MAKFDYKRLNTEIRQSAKQRIEDNQIFSTTHLQDLMGEDAIVGHAFNEESVEAESGFFEFDQQEYKFSHFNDLTFGCEAAENEEELQHVKEICFYYCDFSMCGFSNVIFENCAFVGCNFTECYTLGFTTIFRDCRFMNRVKKETNIDDAPSMFFGSELSAKFINTDLAMTVFEKSHFYFSSFDKTSLKSTLFIDSSFDTVMLSDCDLRGTKILNPKFIEFYFEDSLQKTKVSKKTYLDRINFNPKEEREVRFASEVYNQISELFESYKMMDLSGEYFYLFKDTESINLKGFSKFKSFLAKMTCGYGERPFFSLLTSLVLILTCGTLYMFYGVNINNEVISFQPSLQQLFPPIDQLITWYHFSLVTFSTVGYGNVVPVGGSLIVSAFEMVFGIIMVGIWVSTLVRKMVR